MTAQKQAFERLSFHLNKLNHSFLQRKNGLLFQANLLALGTYSLSEAIDYPATKDPNTYNLPPNSQPTPSQSTTAQRLPIPNKHNGKKRYFPNVGLGIYQ